MAEGANKDNNAATNNQGLSPAIVAMLNSGNFSGAFQSAYDSTLKNTNGVSGTRGMDSGVGTYNPDNAAAGQLQYLLDPNALKASGVNWTPDNIKGYYNALDQNAQNINQNASGAAFQQAHNVFGTPYGQKLDSANSTLTGGSLQTDPAKQAGALQAALNSGGAPNPIYNDYQYTLDRPNDITKWGGNLLGAGKAAAIAATIYYGGGALGDAMGGAGGAGAGAGAGAEAGAAGAEGAGAGTVGSGVVDAGTTLGGEVGSGLSFAAPDAISLSLPTVTSAGIGSYMPSAMIGNALTEAGMPGWAASGIGGAVQGGAISGLTGGDIGKGMLMGGIGGSFGQGGIGQNISSGVSNAVGGGAMGNVLGSAASGAVGNGIGALATGNDPLKAAGMGALTSGAGSALYQGLNASGINGGLTDAIGKTGTGIVDSTLNGALKGAITGQGAGTGALYGGANAAGNAAFNGASNWLNGSGSNSSSSSGPALQQADFSSSMPTAADFQNPNIDLSGVAPGPLSLSGNNMSSTDPFAVDYSLTAAPNYGNLDMSGTSQGGGVSTMPSNWGIDPSTGSYSSNPTSLLDPSMQNFINSPMPNYDFTGNTTGVGGAWPSDTSGGTKAATSSGTGGSFLTKLMSQLGIGSSAGKGSLSPLQQIAGLAGLTGVIGSALNGNTNNQTPNYQSIPGSAAASYGSGSGGGGGFNWTNYGYQPRTQNHAMQDPNIDWSHYGEQSQAQKPGGGVFFTPAAGAPVNAAFGPSQQQPVPGHAAGGSIAPLQQLASMAPHVAMQNHVSNMNPPQPVMGPQPGQMQMGQQPEGGGDGFDNGGPPHMGPDFGDILRGPRPTPQLGGTGNMPPGRMQAPQQRPMMGGMDRGDRFNGDAFAGHPMMGGMGRQPMMGGPQPVHGAMGLNPGAMPMQPGQMQMTPDPGSQLNIPQQSGMSSDDIQAMGPTAAMAGGGSAGSEAGYTGLPADGGNSYWQAVKDRIGEIVGSHNVGTGAADRAAQKLQGRGKQIDDAVAAADHAQGGEIMSPLQHFAGHGYVQGPGDGQSDDIPAKLSNGEYVISADVVSALGNGSNEVGANKLDAMMQNVRKSISKNHAKGELQPKAKDPHAYLGKG
jgi:hypothetical protein